MYYSCLKMGKGGLGQTGELGSVAGLIREDQVIQKMGKFLGLGYQFIQVRCFFNTLGRSVKVFRALITFERLLDSGTVKGVLSKTYFKKYLFKFLQY